MYSLRWTWKRYIDTTCHHGLAVREEEEEEELMSAALAFHSRRTFFFFFFLAFILLSSFCFLWDIQPSEFAFSVCLSVCLCVFPKRLICTSKARREIFTPNDEEQGPESDGEPVVWRPTQMQRPYRNYKDEKEIDVPIIILCVLYTYYTVYRGKLEKINERQHIIIYPKRSSGKVYRASHSVIFLIWRQ